LRLNDLLQYSPDVIEIDGCISCAFAGHSETPQRERIHVGRGWRVAHAFGTALPGWLVLLPHRHLISLDEMTTEEAAELGPLLRAVTHALREVTGCEKTYVALFAEAEGFEHLHFHIIPRSEALGPARRGPYVFELLGGDPGRHVTESVRDKISADVGAALAARLKAFD
jgi:diadenosine tetraphosphate (Ap4A) HIT family hydrolase